jgi:hypothetical protein
MFEEKHSDDELNDETFGENEADTNNLSEFFQKTRTPDKLNILEIDLEEDSSFNNLAEFFKTPSKTNSNVMRKEESPHNFYTKNTPFKHHELSFLKLQEEDEEEEEEFNIVNIKYLFKGTNKRPKPFLLYKSN